MTAIAATNLPAAVGAVDGASSSCLTLDGSITGLVYPYDFPDPFVLHDGRHLLRLRHQFGGGQHPDHPVHRPQPLVHRGERPAPRRGVGRPHATWGPSVLQRGNTFVLYYSAVYVPTGEQCISEAVANQPQGPYVDSSTVPLICQTALGGSIDPTPFVDAGGTPYLVWKSQGAGGQPSVLWSQQLTADGTGLVPTAATPLLAPGEPWQGGVVEGPSLALVGGQYLLFYSANDWKTADYAIGMAVCAGPLGPCQPSGQPLLTSQSGLSGPGGPSVFVDGQGHLQMAFHAWLPGKVGFPNSRLLFIRRSPSPGTWPPSAPESAFHHRGGRVPAILHVPPVRPLASREVLGPPDGSGGDGRWGTRVAAPTRHPGNGLHSSGRRQHPRGHRRHRTRRHHRRIRRCGPPLQRVGRSGRIPSSNPMFPLVTPSFRSINVGIRTTKSTLINNNDSTHLLMV